MEKVQMDFMDPKTFTFTTDDHTWLPKFARAGLIVRGPKLKFSFRFFRWLYWLELKHMSNVARAEQRS